MQKQGKFILMNIDEFKDWLIKQNVKRKIKYIQIHHTYIPSYKDFKNKNHFKLLESMEEAHKERGFSEIAQNVTIFPDGLIAICRSFETIPAGIKGWNSNAICIENIGNFDLGKDKITEEHKNSIVKTVALLCKKFNLDISIGSILYHSWFNLLTGACENSDGKKIGDNNFKSCPGSNYFSGNSSYDCAHNFLPMIRSELMKL